MTVAKRQEPPTWEDWLDELTDAAARLERQLAEGEPVAFPDLSAPPLAPGSPNLPRRHMARAAQLLDRLRRVESTVEAQRDSLSAQLQALPAGRRVRSGAVPSYELGAALDITG